MLESYFRGLDDITYLFVELYRNNFSTSFNVTLNTKTFTKKGKKLAGSFRLSQIRQPIIHDDTETRSIINTQNDADNNNCLWSRCPLCKQPMQEPRLLDCLHPICSSCVEAIQTVGVDAGTLATSWLQEERGCPICDHPLPTSKSPVPPPHYPLQHQLLMNAVFTRQILCYCDVCQEQNQASLHCSTCLYNFCQDCGAKHHQTQSKNGAIHEVWPLWQAKRFRRTTVCLEHPEYPLRFYCIACQQVTCSECMWRGVHRGHATEEHTAPGKNAATMLASAIRSARALLDSLLIRYTANSFSSSRMCRSRCSNQSRSRIGLDREESLYAKEARHRIEEFTRLRNARHLLDAISLTEQLLNEGSDAEILSLSRIILKRFNALGVNVRLSSLINDDIQQDVRHSGVFHCCTFCSSGGKKEATCACSGTMLGGYKGCGHGHPGHPGVKHWSCCGAIDRNSECPRLCSQKIVYRFTL